MRNKILVVTPTITSDAEGISGDVNDEGGLLKLPDWVLNEIDDGKVVESISTLLADLRVMGAGFMMEEPNFRKSISNDDNNLTEEQVVLIEDLLTKHGIIMDLGDVIRINHPEWSEEEIEKEVARVFGN